MKPATRKNLAIALGVLLLSAFPVDFKLSRIHADVSIPPLLKKKIVLNRLRLESPDVHLRLQPGPQETTPGAMDQEGRGIESLNMEHWTMSNSPIQPVAFWCRW